MQSLGLGRLLGSRSAAEVSPDCACEGGDEGGPEEEAGEEGECLDAFAALFLPVDVFEVEPEREFVEDEGGGGAVGEAGEAEGAPAGLVLEAVRSSQA